MTALMGPLRHELLVQILFDGSGRCCGSQVLLRQDGPSFSGRHRALIEQGFSRSAAGFLLVHNHPSGHPRPSRRDIAATRSIMAVSRAVGLELSDHWIVAAGGAVSMRRLGLVRAPERGAEGGAYQRARDDAEEDPMELRARTGTGHGGMQDRAILDAASAASKLAQRRRSILGVHVDGEVWELMVGAFLARFRRARDPLPVVPRNGTLHEALDPVVTAGLAVLVPDPSSDVVHLELSDTGMRRVRRHFATMARDEARAAAAEASRKA